MRVIHLFAAVLASAVLLAGCSPSSPPPYSLAIKNVTVVDTEAGERGPVDVWFDGELIAAITDAGVQPYRAAAEIDGSDRFLIPGLWDAHVHLSYAPDIDHTVFFPLSLAHGITSLRDTGGHLELLTEARALALRDDTPSLYVAGPLIDGAPKIYDGSHRFLPDMAISVSSVEEAEAAVRELAEAGADFVKAYELLDPDVFRAVNDTAESLGLPVAAHTPLLMSAADAARAGADDMQHLRNLNFDCASSADELLDERIAMLVDREGKRGSELRSSVQAATRARAIADESDEACDTLLAVLAEADTRQTPTLTINTFMTARLFDEQRWRDTLARLPAAVRERWLADADGLADQSPSETQAALAQWSVDMIPRLAAAGVPIMAGTDAPIALLTPGLSLHEELAMLVDAGLTPTEALHAATLEPARFFGLDGELGRIEPGYRADAVLLRANPLSDIRNTLSVESVVKNGVLHDRAALDALLATVATVGGG